MTRSVWATLALLGCFGCADEAGETINIDVVDQADAAPPDDMGPDAHPDSRLADVELDARPDPLRDAATDVLADAWPDGPRPDAMPDAPLDGPAPAICTTDLECIGERVCVDGACQADPCGADPCPAGCDCPVRCGSHRDCAEDEGCDLESGMCVVGCRDDLQPSTPDDPTLIPLPGGYDDDGYRRNTLSGRRLCSASTDYFAIPVNPAERIQIVLSYDGDIVDPLNLRVTGERFGGLETTDGIGSPKIIEQPDQGVVVGGETYRVEVLGRAGETGADYEIAVAVACADCPLPSTSDTD